MNWTMADIDKALADINGPIIEKLRVAKTLGQNRPILITMSCAKLYCSKKLREKYKESSRLLKEVFIYSQKTGYIVKG